MENVSTSQILSLLKEEESFLAAVKAKLREQIHILQVDEAMISARIQLALSRHQVPRSPSEGVGAACERAENVPPHHPYLLNPLGEDAQAGVESMDDLIAHLERDLEEEETEDEEGLEEGE